MIQQTMFPKVVLSVLAGIIGLKLTLANTDVTIDKSYVSHRFDGLGGLSGGGATSRLLIDYKEPQRSEILDYLFLPKFGASLQILKVEIGGDSQSTDGTETSHMHSAEDLNYHRGYEWWLMMEAKKRNPDIKLYGLAWAYPGWVGNGSGSPFSHPDLTSEYILKWISGAKTIHNLTIDYVGVWNERPSSSEYVITLRKVLDTSGFKNVQIVAKDGGSDICDQMQKDKDYNDAVSIIGLHYPSDFSNYTICHLLNKPFWASEESSSYDDLNGAACWARVVTSHWVLSKMTSSIMWNLIGSYYHGTKWYASSMMTAVQPWSGYYEVAPVIWATAHITQFTVIGWHYLDVGHGSGELNQGGYYTTMVDVDEGNNFTINVVKISRQHAPCTRPSLPSFVVDDETVTFELSKTMGNVDKLFVWYSNFEIGSPIFEQQGTINVVDNKFTINVAVGSFYTISTIGDGQKGNHGNPPQSSPSFPLPYKDDFDSYNDSQEAHYFSDQIGAFEVHSASVDVTTHKGIMCQMVPSLPIGWTDHGSNGPVSVIGMREWADITVGVEFNIPEAAPTSSSACLATRADQMWHNGIVLCITADSSWALTYGGPSVAKTHRFDGDQQLKNTPVLNGTTPHHIEKATWYALTLTTINESASATLNGDVLFLNTTIKNLDTGFAAIGTNGWFAIEFDNFFINEAGPDWHPQSPCAAASAGTMLGTRDCPTNGRTTDDTVFELLWNWQIRHPMSGLCVMTKSPEAGSSLALAHCESNNALQQFVNDYTRIRNSMMPMTLLNQSLLLVGSTNGTATVQPNNSRGFWTKWVYFPNTGQLRNQYTANGGLGYPMCLSTCTSTQTQ